MLRAGGRNCEGVEEVEGKKKDARLTTQGRSRKSAFRKSQDFHLRNSARNKNPKQEHRTSEKQCARTGFSAPFQGVGGI